MKRAARAWERFWFAPEPTSSLAIFRIAIGVVSFAWALSLLPDLSAFFSSHGVEPRPPYHPPLGVWGVLNTFPNYSVAIALYVTLLVATLCLIVGYHTRVASVLVFVAVLSFEHRAPSIWNSGDALLRNVTFFLMLAPAGAALSVDRWRRARDRFWEFPARAPWALRLVQIQISVVYLSTMWLKLHGPAWLHGTAISYAARMADYNRFPLPAVFSHSPFFSAVMTYWTMAVELMLGILVWNRRARPFVLALGVALHVVLGLTMTLAFFSETMVASYLAFLSPAAAATFIRAVRGAGSAMTSRVHHRPGLSVVVPDDAPPTGSDRRRDVDEVGVSVGLASSPDEEVGDRADRLHGAREHPRHPPASNLPGRATGQVAQRDGRHDQLGDRARHDRRPLPRRQVGPTLLRPWRLLDRRLVD